jgi:hypothetical protein
VAGASGQPVTANASRVPVFVLQPGAGAPAGLMGRVQTLGHEAFELARIAASTSSSMAHFERLRDQSRSEAPMQWKLARGVLGSPELSVSRFTYEPGARMPFGHPRKQEEAYVIAAGSGRAKLDDQEGALSRLRLSRSCVPEGGRHASRGT